MLAVSIKKYNASVEPQTSGLTVDAECGRLGLGKECALVESLAGQGETVLRPGDLVGYVGHGCHPTMVPLHTQRAHTLV